jgi:hypothetical protein
MGDGRAIWAQGKRVYWRQKGECRWRMADSRDLQVDRAGGMVVSWYGRRGGL